MTTTTEGTSRTARLLALMKKGDAAFNARDFAAVDEVHHPDMVAYIPGLAEPVYGREAHAAAGCRDGPFHSAASRPPDKQDATAASAKRLTEPGWI